MKGNMIKEHDRIVLKTDFAAEGLEAGDVGTVVHIYNDGLAYDPELKRVPCAPNVQLHLGSEVNALVDDPRADLVSHGLLPIPEAEAQTA